MINKQLLIQWVENQIFNENNSIEEWENKGVDCTFFTGKVAAWEHLLNMLTNNKNEEC